MQALTAWRLEQEAGTAHASATLSLSDKDALWVPPPGTSDADYDQSWRFRDSAGSAPDGTGSWTVNVLIDHGWTMEVWHPVIREFLDLLQARALAVTVQEHALDSQTGAISRCSPATPAPDTPALALVITDGLSPWWASDLASNLLYEWAAQQPLAVVHLLPRALWESSNIQAGRSVLRASERAQANTALHMEGYESSETACPVPVLELTKEDLQAWGQLVVQKARTTLYCVCAGQAAMVPGQSRSPLLEQDVAGTIHQAADGPQQRLQLFRTSASRQAQFLASALSLLPLNLAVLHHTQETLLPQYGPELFSELFIAQLIQPVDTAESLSRVDRVTFEFATGVREHLVSGLDQQWTANLFTSTAVFLDEILGIPWVSAWRHLIENPGTTIAQVTDASAPFLKVELTVLEALSGRFRPRARRLREALRAHEKPASLARSD